MDSDQLIEATRNAGSIPDTGSLGATDPDLLAHADHGILTYLLPRLLNLREEHYVLRQRTSVTGTRTRLPKRAAFNKLRDLYFIPDSTTRLYLPSIDPDELADFQPGATLPAGYIVEGNRVILIPYGGTFTGSLEFAFYARPGSLVPTTSARRIVSVDTGTGEIVLDSDPPATWSPSTLFDIHSPESGAELNIWDATVSAVGPGATLTFSSPIDGSVFGTTTPQTGDWVVIATQAAAPALPIELHPIAARAAALALAEASGDVNQAKLHASIIDKFLTEITKAMETRVDAHPAPLGGTGPVACRLSGYLRPRHTL